MNRHAKDNERLNIRNIVASQIQKPQHIFTIHLQYYKILRAELYARDQQDIFKPLVCLFARTFGCSFEIFDFIGTAPFCACTIHDYITYFLYSVTLTDYCFFFTLQFSIPSNPFNSVRNSDLWMCVYAVFFAIGINDNE